MNARPANEERETQDVPARRAVALVTPAWPPGTVPNGIVTYTFHMVAGLRARDMDVHVVTGRDDSPARDPRVSVPATRRAALRWRLLRRVGEVFAPGAVDAWRGALELANEIRRLHQEHGVELVEMEESFGLCGLVADRAPVPVVARLHGPWFLTGPTVADPNTKDFANRERREGRAIGRVAAVSAPSREVLDRTRAHYGVALEGAEVIPNPVPGVPDAERWDPRRSEERTILFVGRFDRLKGGDVLIDAFARIRARDPRVSLVFVGPDRGMTDDAGRRWGLEEFLADRLPRAPDREAVRWLGPQPASAIPDLRRRAAVTVVCSRWENFPYSLGEAMVHGCPIVATATGGMLEMITDARDGLLVRPGDPDDLARATLELLLDPERAAALGARAAETATRLLSPEAIALRTERFYDRVLARGTTSPRG
jgi:glycosyltransferase involved in cell wall biosynthesis